MREKQVEGIAGMCGCEQVEVNILASRCNISSVHLICFTLHTKQNIHKNSVQRTYVSCDTKIVVTNQQRTKEAEMDGYRSTLQT